MIANKNAWNPISLSNNNDTTNAMSIAIDQMIGNNNATIDGMQITSDTMIANNDGIIKEQRDCKSWSNTMAIDD